MSVNPDAMDGIDYSDFEYQQIYHTHKNDNLTGSPADTTILTEYEVLGGIGGLDNNEVAELAYMEVQVSMEHEQSEDDQNVGSQTTLEGIVGANLPPTQDLLPGAGSPQPTTVVDSQGADASQVGSVTSEDRVFQPFHNHKGPAFDDETNGVGGSGGQTTTVIKKPWRELVGRGPVLDSSDELNVLSRLIQEDEIMAVNGNVTVHCVWDVAETSDAGRAFSVPMDD